MKEEARPQCDSTKKPKRDELMKMKAKGKLNPQIQLHKSIFRMKQPNLRKKKKITGKYESPTDRLLSPCSKKLSNFKTKFIENKTTPMKLSFSSGNKL